MLCRLTVENYALIDRLDIEFAAGLNIITGETGAGKSILLGALGLVLGARADAAAIKDSGRNCVVEAEFDVRGYGLEPLFGSLDVDYDERTVVRRVITPAGKSRAYVNDLPVQLTAVREARGGGSVIAVQDVAPEATNKYGIVSVDDTSLQTSQMRGIVEKPDPKVAPSRMAVIGRYVFEPEVFDYLEKVTVGVGGEIQLTDGIASSLDTVPTYAHRFEGTRFDCGSKQGFLDATIHFARKRGFKIN